MGQTKGAIRNMYNGGVLWCAVCLSHLVPQAVWLSYDSRDGRVFCYDCAPRDAIRANDTIEATYYYGEV